ncbi:MAG: hypothetical protein A3K23_03660 [Desulfobacca sp. RBG_16_58_9]|nr:MAG: hypothetical protein A3K23_03660 [Desulfobacca sp. RBG_16_58_9]
MIYWLRELQIRIRGFCASSGLLTAGGRTAGWGRAPQEACLRIFLISTPGLSITLLALRPGEDYFIMKLS